MASVANVDHESLQLHIEVSQVPNSKFDEYHPSVLQTILNAAKVPLEPAPTPPEVNPDAHRITRESPPSPSDKAIVPTFSVSHVLHAMKRTALNEIRPGDYTLGSQLMQSGNANGELESAPAEIARRESEPLPTKIEAFPSWRILEYQEGEIRAGRLGTSMKVAGNADKAAELVISITLCPDGTTLTSSPTAGKHPTVIKLPTSLAPRSVQLPYATTSDVHPA